MPNYRYFSIEAWVAGYEALVSFVQAAHEGVHNVLSTGMTHSKCVQGDVVQVW